MNNYTESPKIKKDYKNINFNSMSLTSKKCDKLRKLRELNYNHYGLDDEKSPQPVSNNEILANRSI